MPIPMTVEYFVEYFEAHRVSSNNNIFQSVYVGTSACTRGYDCIQSLDWTGLDYWTPSELKVKHYISILGFTGVIA